MPERDIEEGWSAVAELVREGKVRYAGVSNFNVAQMKRAQAIHPDHLAAAALQHGQPRGGGRDPALLRRAAHRRHRLLADAGGPAHRPLQPGAAGRPRPGGLAPARSLLPGAGARPHASSSCEQLRPLAEREGLTPAQLAIAWVLRRPEMTAAIVGARRPEQIEETAAAGDCAPAPELLAELDRLLGDGGTASARPE